MADGNTADTEYNQLGDIVEGVPGLTNGYSRLLFGPQHHE